MEKKATQKKEIKETRKEQRENGQREDAKEVKTQKQSAAAEPESFQETTRLFDKAVLVALLGVVVVAGLVVGGVVYSQQAFKKQAEKKVCPSPSPCLCDLEPSPSATAAASLDKKLLTIKVLNGSGVAGSAGKLASYLKEQGYGNLETGNADTQDYETTEIQIKASKEAYLKLLTKDLEEKFATPSSQVSLDEEEKSDAIIIVGKK